MCQGGHELGSTRLLSRAVTACGMDSYSLVESQATRCALMQAVGAPWPSSRKMSSRFSSFSFFPAAHRTCIALQDSACDSVGCVQTHLRQTLLKGQVDRMLLMRVQSGCWWLHRGGATYAMTLDGDITEVKLSHTDHELMTVRQPTAGHPVWPRILLALAAQSGRVC